MDDAALNRIPSGKASKGPTIWNTELVFKSWRRWKTEELIRAKFQTGFEPGSPDVALVFFPLGVLEPVCHDQPVFPDRIFELFSLSHLSKKEDWWMPWFNQCQIEKTIIGVNDEVKLVPNKANSPRTLTMDQFFVNSFLTEAYWLLKNRLKKAN